MQNLRLAQGELADLPPAPPGLRHLNLISRCVEKDEVMLGHIRHALTLGLPELGCSLVRNNGDFVICGSGPSLADELETLTELKAQKATICAVNDAHDFLIQHGILPDIAVMLDPTEQMKNRIKTPHSDVTYIIASQCHPAVFEALQGNSVVLWHALGLMGEDKILGNRMLVGGATTVGLRSLNIGYLLGFHKFHLFGLDSCLKGDALRITGEGVKNNNIMEVVCGERIFRCNPAMAGQANDFQQALSLFGDNIRIKAYGDGLIQYILKERVKLGHSDW